MTVRDLERLLRSNGFELVRTTGHKIYKKGDKVVAVPNHPSQDIAQGTLSAILKQAGLK